MLPVNYAFRFSGLMTALRAGAKSEIDCPEASQLPSPVTDQKLLLLTNFYRQVIFPIAYQTLRFPIRQVHKLLNLHPCQ
jgi:hypothetical protein